MPDFPVISLLHTFCFFPYSKYRGARHPAASNPSSCQCLWWQGELRHSSLAGTDPATVLRLTAKDLSPLLARGQHLPAPESWSRPEEEESETVIWSPRCTLMTGSLQNLVWRWPGYRVDVSSTPRNPLIFWQKETVKSSSFSASCSSRESGLLRVQKYSLGLNSYSVWCRPLVAPLVPADRKRSQRSSSALLDPDQRPCGLDFYGPIRGLIYSPEVKYLLSQKGLFVLMES